MVGAWLGMGGWLGWIGGSGCWDGATDSDDEMTEGESIDLVHRNANDGSGLAGISAQPAQRQPGRLGHASLQRPSH